MSDNHALLEFKEQAANSFAYIALVSIVPVALAALLWGIPLPTGLRPSSLLGVTWSWRMFGFAVLFYAWWWVLYFSSVRLGVAWRPRTLRLLLRTTTPLWMSGDRSVMTETDRAALIEGYRRKANSGIDSISLLVACCTFGLSSAVQMFSQGGYAGIERLAAR